MFSKLTTSAYFLIASNIIPVFMVSFNHWSLNEILTVYWAESGVIGFFNIFKILLASKISKPQIKIPVNMAILKIFMAMFFCFHFGMFMFVHGVFLFGLVLGGFKSSSSLSDNFIASVLNIKIMLIALFISHGYSFLKNFIINGEKNYLTVDQVMVAPYSRIVIMHITILAGAFLMLFLKLNNAFLIVFIIMKIFFDLKGHLKERIKISDHSMSNFNSISG
ncbi:MAG: DUF6498-containing protein [Elusimicrobiota bacterium]